MYYFQAFDESFGFLLREKNIQNLDASLATDIRIEKNLLAAKKFQDHPSKLFDPHGRTFQEPKKEMGAENNEVPARFVVLLQDLKWSN